MYCLFLAFICLFTLFRWVLASTESSIFPDLCAFLKQVFFLYIRALVSLFIQGGYAWETFISSKGAILSRPVSSSSSRISQLLSGLFSPVTLSQSNVLNCCFSCDYRLASIYLQYKMILTVFCYLKIIGKLPIKIVDCTVLKTNRVFWREGIQRREQHDITKLDRQFFDHELFAGNLLIGPVFS